MKKILKLVISTARTGCIDPANYATTPVSVTTETGTVICQLYRTNNVLWDEAISIPPGMSISTGDAICKNKGHSIIKSQKSRSFWNVVKTNPKSPKPSTTQVGFRVL